MFAGFSNNRVRESQIVVRVYRFQGLWVVVRSGLSRGTFVAVTLSERPDVTCGPRSLVWGAFAVYV